MGHNAENGNGGQQDEEVEDCRQNPWPFRKRCIVSYPNQRTSFRASPLAQAERSVLFFGHREYDKETEGQNTMKSIAMRLLSRALTTKWSSIYRGERTSHQGWVLHEDQKLRRMQNTYLFTEVSAGSGCLGLTSEGYYLRYQELNADSCKLKHVERLCGLETWLDERGPKSTVKDVLACR